MAEPPRLVFTALNVQDLEVSVRFYRDVLGIPLQERSYEAADPWVTGPHFEHVWRDGAYLNFSLRHGTAGQESRRVQVGFEVENLGAAHARAVAGGADVLHPPRAQPWGRTARYRDPDGNTVSLTQIGERGS